MSDEGTEGRRGSESMDEEIQQDDAWSVISSYFEEKGLVRQQLDSFNEFLEHSLQEIVEETSEVEVTAETRSKEGQIGALRQVVSFGQLYLAQPSQGTDNARINPNEARLRNLHYSCTLRVDLTRTTYTPTETEGVLEQTDSYEQVRLGAVPIMLRSSYCWTSNCKTAQELSDMGECPYDQGGYFILRGSEKVGVFGNRVCCANCFFRC
jgi:DNA-directed RNA polymerase II subunit RPB2